MIEARFDDLTAVGRSFRLVGPGEVFRAAAIEEVPGVIAEAARAATNDRWVAGFVSYEAAPGIDPALRVRERPSDGPFHGLPLAWFCPFERRESTELPEPRDDGSVRTTWEPSIDRDRYDGAIAKIRDRIAGGDTYQINYTFRLRAPFDGDPRALYRDICFAQRAAHAAYLDTGDFQILSASPELFVEIHDGRITTRPMKGTAPRGRYPAEDRSFADALRASAKDRAENAMIVDLLRNDLGRIAEAGSVTWGDVFEVERYETVWQLTTTVQGALRGGTTLTDVFRALFPSGSVTGAPKVRSMDLITDLEDSPRGVYCGAVGFLAPGGSLDAAFNVAIRTVTLDPRSGIAEYGVGGGITWDSRAVAEYDEALAKSAVLVERRPRFELVETLRHDPEDGYARLDLHLERLRSSAEHFGFLFDEHEVRSALQRTASGGPAKPLRVRLTLDPRGRVSVGAVPLLTPEGPVRIELDAEEPVDSTDPMLFHKTTLRDRYARARERHPDADDVVLVNTHGEITETTVANIAVELDGRWWTPPLDAGLLPGVERAAMLADGTLGERPITPDELGDAGGIAVLSSVRGRRPAVLVQSALGAGRSSGNS